MQYRLSPFIFVTGAEKYLDAANSVCKPPITMRDKLTCAGSFPAYFLIGHSIELSLKAFLFARGVKVNQLRNKYSHDLEKLITESRRRKLGREVKLSKAHISAIKILNVPYKRKLLEYSKVGTYTLPQYWLIFEVASNLVNGLYSFCYKSTFNRELPFSQAIRRGKV
jgi:hypothetical protein